MAGIDIVFVVPTFNGAERLDFMMRTIEQNDPDVLKEKWIVVEDPSGRIGVTAAYEDACEEYGFDFVKLPKWSNMHGAAMAAFDIAIERYDPKWIIYLGDDLAITPGSVTNLLRFIRDNVLRNIGLVVIPYHNSHELRPSDDKLKWFYKDTNWTRNVPRSVHWDGEGYSRPYINVNGAGFACRSSMYQSVGGFAEGTWCLDESISYRCWTRSDYSIVTLPGPPVVHFFGASLLAKPPQHDLWSDENWTKAIGKTKAECDKEMRAIMEERTPKVLEEMKSARYFPAA